MTNQGLLPPPSGSSDLTGRLPTSATPGLEWRAGFIFASIVIYIAVDIGTAAAYNGQALVGALIQSCLFCLMLWLLYRLFVQRNREWYICTHYLMVCLGIGSLSNFIVYGIELGLVNRKAPMGGIVCIIISSGLNCVAISFYFQIQGNYGQMLPMLAYPNYAGPGYSQPFAQQGPYTQMAGYAPYLAPSYPPPPGYQPPEYYPPVQGYAPPPEFAAPEIPPPYASEAPPPDPRPSQFVDAGDGQAPQ
jgi:hypothetical protein